MNKYDIIFIKNTINKPKDYYALYTVKQWMKREINSPYEVMEAIQDLESRNIFRIIIKPKKRTRIQINRVNYDKLVSEYYCKFEKAPTPPVSYGRELQLSFEDSIRKSLQK